MRKHLKKIIPLVLLLTGASFMIPVESIQVRIFTHLKVSACQVKVQAGNYRLLADGNLLAHCQQGTEYKFFARGDSVLVMSHGTLLGIYRYLKLAGNDGAELKIKLLEPERKERIYQNNVGFSIFEGGIRMLNEVLMDNYIAGVTEAEAGSKASPEFYKVQAILVRTFALAHINKHVTEGFSLCDQVHCQAYFGKPRNMSVYNAIKSTKGQVVVDENLNLIVAAFHSNSGGQTANSEDVWGSKTSYLRSIVDSFSTRMPNAKWERKMLAEDWLSYLKIKHNFPVDVDSGRNLALTFKQESRKTFLEFNDAKVPLKNVRQDLQLKSTFFTITRLNNDSILFSGRGYGHGLGMCQEGAMCMAKKGYSYKDIIRFYYQNTQLIDLHKLEFFKDE
jgi:stage II sporulation protein D